MLFQSTFVVDIIICCSFLMFDNAWIAKHNAMAWHIAIHITVGCYQDIITNGNLTYYRSVDSYPNTIADGGRTFTTATVFPSDGYPFVDITISANDGILIYSDAIHMSQVKPRTYVTLPIQLNMFPIP